MDYYQDREVYYHRGRARSCICPCYEYDNEYYRESQHQRPRSIFRHRVQFDEEEDYFNNCPHHKEKGEAAEPAPEAKAKAEVEDTAQVAEDGPHPVEVEVAEADQLGGQNNEIGDGCCRKEIGKLQK